MMNSKTLTMVTFTALLLAGCAGMGVSTEEQKQRYQQALAAAQAAHDKAVSVNYVWRDTAGIIKAAKKAAEKGEWDKAIKLAESAKAEGELAYAQYLDQEDAGNVGIR